MKNLTWIWIAPLACGLWFAPQGQAEEPKASVVGTVQIPLVKKYATVVYLDSVVKPMAGDTSQVVIMHQKGKAFAPRVLPVAVGTTVEFLNEDSFQHNVFSPDFPPGEPAKGGQKYYDLGSWGQGEKRFRKFDRVGIYTQLCALHPEMSGYIMVLPNPYFASVDPDGNFRIDGVPPGDWKIKVWNEHMKPKQLEKSYGVSVLNGSEAKVVITP